MANSLTLAPLAALTAAPAKRDLAAHLAALTDGQLQSLAYGEHANEILDCEVPDWLAEAAYDEQDRRMEAMIAAGALPELVEVDPPFPTLHFMKGKKRIEGRSWKALSEASGVGGSSRCWKNRIICTADGQPVAHINFNAKVWAGTEYVAGAEPLYDPYAEVREAQRAAYAAESITAEYRAL